jgi:integrase
LDVSQTKLTASSIRSLTLPPGVTDKVFFDADLPGFGLRVRASGSHSWMVQYAIAGKTRRIVLGLASALDASQARATAKTLLAQVRLGRDPAAEKEQARARLAETFAALLPRFLARQRARLKPRSYQETERHLQMHAKALHGRPIEAVDRRAIAGLLAGIAETRGPAASNRVRASLSAYLTWCAREGYVDANPVSFTNQAVEKGARTRVLSDDELRTIWVALDDDQYGAILKLLMLTAARRTEISDLTWAEVDFDAATITLPPERTKNGREHIIPLSEPARVILAAQPRRVNADGSERNQVFGLRSRKGGLQDWSSRKPRLDARITAARDGKPLDWTLHDFRRSISTALHERFGVLPHVVEAILGHVGGHKAGVAGTYNQAIYLDERWRALARWGAHIMAIVSGVPVTAAVVSLRRKRG